MDVKKQIIYRQIGAKVAYYRTLRGLTQEALAKKMNISRSTISRIEQGRYNRSISLDMVIDLSEGLRIDCSSLLTFSDLEKRMWWDFDEMADVPDDDNHGES